MPIIILMEPLPLYYVLMAIIIIKKETIMNKMSTNGHKGKSHLSHGRLLKSCPSK